MISQKIVRDLFDYDYQSGILVSKRNNIPLRNDYILDGYAQVSINNNQYSAHQVIWLWLHGYFVESIKHIDGDRLNNRIDNLRPDGRTKNHLDKKARFPGIAFQTKTERYVVNMLVENEIQEIGSFNSLEEAYFAYRMECYKRRELREVYFDSLVMRLYTKPGVHHYRASDDYQVVVQLGRELIDLGFHRSFNHAKEIHKAAIEQIAEVYE